MLLTSFTLVIALIGVVFLWLRKHYAYWAERGVPHEQPNFFVGNMKGIGTLYHWKDINKRIYERFKNTRAPFVGFYTFLTKAAFIIDLELIRQIMVKDFGSFANRGLFHNVRDDPLTGNLLFLDGEQWRVLRHKLSPVFTTGKLRYMFPTMVKVGERLVDTCSALLTASTQSADKSVPIEAKDLCARYTTDVIGTCAFGIECNSLKDPNAEFRHMGRSVVEEPRHSLPVQAFMFTNPTLARKLRMKNFTDEASAFFMNAVHETVAYREQNNIKRGDFMDMLIELKQLRDRMGEGEDADDLTNGLTMDQVAAQAMVFFMAGFETSSTTMSFCIYELALNQSIQTQLRTEIQQVLAKHNGEVSYESIKEMFYLEKVLSETLRKYSVLPHILRQAVTDYKVPDSDVVFEKDLRIIIPVDSIHHDPEYYPEPEKFDPERFTATAIDARHPFAYLPFGDGPRNCIGSRFGKMQARIGLITLLRHFKFTASELTQIPLRFSKKNFLINSESGIHLNIERA